MTADNQSNETEENAVDNTNQEATAQQQKEPVKGPGHLLKEAREAKNLSQREVADRLRLRLQIIELLEADEYDSFSTPTFIKGYLRSYAKLLDADDEKIFAAYRQLGIQEPDTTAMQSFSRRVKHQESDNRLMLITYAVIVVVIALVIWWWQDSDLSFNQLSDDVQGAVEQPQQTQEPQSTNTVEQPVPEQSSNQQQPEEDVEPLLESEVDSSDTSTSLSANDPETQSDQSDQSEQPEQSDQAMTVTDTEQVDTTLESVNEPVAEDSEPEQQTSEEESATTVTNAAETESELAEVNEPVAEQSPAADPQLVFEFNEECWVKVDDATGETQAVGVKGQGYQMPVPGEAPFSVTVCKPEAVSISYQGEAVDLSSFRQARVARFTVPLSN
ncbi:MAG: RodZ domain-containing protein [Pseudomonadota bacterium]